MDDIERIRRLTIIAMFSDDELMEKLVLKGGNALELIYGLAARSSLDLDFSMARDFGAEERRDMRTRVEGLLEATFGPEGYRVLDVRFDRRPPSTSPELEEFWGGYRIKFKIIQEDRARLLSDLGSLRRQAAIVGPKQRRTFSIDISKHEYVGPKEERDLEGYTVYVYPLSAIAIEKLRAICQQSPEYLRIVKSHFAPRARDFFDIYMVLEHFDIDLTSAEHLCSLREIFRAKHVPWGLLAKIELSREDHRADYVALQDSVYPDVNLRPFDFYFDYVVELGQRLLHALGEV